MTKLKIKVTKEILERSKDCEKVSINHSCAIALAVRDIFPLASVVSKSFYPFRSCGGSVGYLEVRLPKKATDFIAQFDGCASEKRINLPELEFEVYLSNAVINQINIEELRPLLINHPTLELV